MDWIPVVLALGVLGVCLLNIGSPITIGGEVLEFNLLYSVLNGIFGALGFLLAIVLMAGVRERLETSKIPDCLKGFSSSLIIAGLMSGEDSRLDAVLSFSVDARGVNHCPDRVCDLGTGRVCYAQKRCQNI